MKICGITAEYNPLHNGHIHHIEETRKKSGCDVLIAVMSGNFVQRGEPAVIDKWQRAEAAVRNGIDAVIELPYIFCTQSASRFAHGSVSLLKKAGCGMISFGSECGNLENLTDIADAPVNPDNLRETMRSGISYPKAYSLLTSEMEPNDILAVCYLREIKDTGIQPVLVERNGSYLDDTMNEMPSAFAIRRALYEKREIAGSSPMEDALLANDPVFFDAYYPYLRTLLLTTDRKRLKEFFLFSEGIEVHLAACAAKSASWEEFLNSAVTHRYTAGRIRRTCLQAMCQMTKEEASSLKEPETIRILAFNDTGRKWLKEMRELEVPVASRFGEYPEKWRRAEYRSTLLYTSVMDEENRNRILDAEIRGARYIR